MDLTINWTKSKYDEFINYLKNFEDLKYKKFNIKIINDESVKFIGVRTKTLRKISKEIAKYDYKNFLSISSLNFYEEKAIYAFIINYVNIVYSSLIDLIKEFIPHISNWSLTDTIAKNYKQFNGNNTFIFNEFNIMVKSKNPWEIRLGLVFLLKTCLIPEYIEKILNICLDIKTEHYYVKIGNSWLVSECYIKFPKITEELLESKKLEKWTHNKAIQKICESLRVTSTEKERIKRLKIN